MGLMICWKHVKIVIIKLYKTKMKRISDAELKLLQLNILKEVHTFCKKNKIRYFLGYGSLIGAIRHKGYIPWDDDIDIIMPRPDYDKFIRIFNTRNLIVIAPEINLNYYAPYANVYDSRTILIEETISHRGFDLGVKIDVFPIDAVPLDLSKYNQYSKKMEYYNKILRIKRIKLLKVKGLKSKVKLAIQKIIYGFRKYSTIQNCIISMAKSEKYDNSKYVDLAVFPVYKRKRFEKTLLDSFFKVEFEGNLFNAPIGYDKYLRIIYDDYMQLPPKEKQFPHHAFTAYWKN